MQPGVTRCRGGRARLQKVGKWDQVPIVIAGIAISLLGLVFYGADIDNHLHVFTSRDLDALLAVQLGGETLEQRIRVKYLVRRWSAYHVGEEAYLTTVECKATDRTGSEALLLWEVAHGYSPYSGIAPRKLFVTPLTRSAAELTPELAPPGFPPCAYPDDLYHFEYSSALYGYASIYWLGGDPARAVPPCAGN